MTPPPPHICKAKMDVENFFHMTGGVGETSYAKNSSLQKKAADMVKKITLETVEEVYVETKPISIGIADLGCSSGPNTLSIIKDIVEAIEATSGRTVNNPSPEEVRVYLNDLPSNDFNSVFIALPDFCKNLKKDKMGGGPQIYIAAYPGSFFGRLFPNQSLHFVYSSYSLHWLSKIPPALYDEQGNSINRGSIYISKASPTEVSKAYLKQFKEDFSLFLGSRSKELNVGGRMVLILLGRKGADHVDRGNSFFWELLSQSFAILVSQGQIEREKLESYEVHFYAPSENEIEDEVRREGSFQLDRMENFELERDETDGLSYGTKVAMTVRAIQETMICQHFGEGILDTLFENYSRLVDEEMTREEIKPITFLLVLRKL
ncbi:jasmonate O-methyltransferase-like [Tripterygium wilfordii]|uniref:jasmonate O-methyltransferase-like n=1 Tax=Tripterygium wilfordii TaxID=458696 RepID=UPI0018F82F23|nr:jasmonate O-methyltransferase-like [Tripterygium wilfordii]